MIIAIFSIFAIFALLYFGVEQAIAWGWIFGWVGVGLLRIVRHFSHQQIGYMLEDGGAGFSKLRYALLVLATLAVIAIPLLIAFIYQEQINPFAVFIPYFLERLITIVQAKRQAKVEEG